MEIFSVRVYPLIQEFLECNTERTQVIIFQNVNDLGHILFSFT